MSDNQYAARAAEAAYGSVTLAVGLASIESGGPNESGRTYTSRPKKMTGPLVVGEQPHLNNQLRQDTALGVLDELIA